MGIDEEKREAKEKKDEEKARKAKERQLKDKEKRKSKNGSIEASPKPLEATALDPIPQLEPITAPVLSEPVDTRVKIGDESSVPGSLDEGDFRSKKATKVSKGPNAHSIESSVRPELRLSESRELGRALVEQPIQFEQTSNGSHYGERRPWEPPKPITKSENVAADGEEVSAASSLETTEAEKIALRVISSPVLPITTSGIVSSTTTDNFSSLEPRTASATPPITRGTRGNPEVALSSESSQAYTKENPEPSTMLGRKETAESRDIQTKPTPESTISGPSLEPKSPRADSITSWLRSKFSRRTSKPAKLDSDDLQDTRAKPRLSDDAHTAAVAENKAGSNAPKGDDNSSLREVAMAGKDVASSTKNQRTKYRTELFSNPIKSHHPFSASEENVGGRPELNCVETGSSVGEEFEEARDHFDLEQMAPPAVSHAAGRGSSSPVRDSRFQENL